MTKGSVLLLLLVSILFIASEEIVGVEATRCEVTSTRFNGVCFRSSNCASVCQSEGFPDGECHGFRCSCMCLKPC